MGFKEGQRVKIIKKDNRDFYHCYDVGDVVTITSPRTLSPCGRFFGHETHRGRKKDVSQFIPEAWLGEDKLPAELWAEQFKGEAPTPSPSGLFTQVGGDHYDFPIQPIEFIVENDIPFREGNIIKYVCRHKKKGGKKDLEKALHYLQMLMEEYE
jgi:hypothetical protein